MRVGLRQIENNQNETEFEEREINECMKSNYCGARNKTSRVPKKNEKEARGLTYSRIVWQIKLHEQREKERHYLKKW